MENLISHMSPENFTTSPTSGYQILSFNYVDSPEFQELMKKVLAGELDPRNIDWDTYLSTTTARSPVTVQDDQNREVQFGNLSLIVPLIVVSFVLLLLLLCFMWKAVQKKCFTNRGLSKNPSVNSLFRGKNNHLRMSTRSNESLNRCGRDSRGMPSVVTKVTPLGSIRESPEDRWKQTEVLDSSVMVDRTTAVDFPYVLSDVGAYPAIHQEAVEAMVHNPPESTHSHPGVDLHHSRLSPYHLAWISASLSQGGSLSDPVLAQKDEERSGSKDFDSMLARPPGSDSKDMTTTASSGRGSVNPKYNTPNNSGSDNNLAQMFINALSSGSTVSPQNLGPGGSSVVGKPIHPAIAALLLKQNRHSLPSYNDSTPGGLSGGSRSSTFDATCASAPLSCPSSVGTWHCNEGYKHPGSTTSHQQPVKNLLTQALLNSVTTNLPSTPENLDQSLPRGQSRGSTRQGETRSTSLQVLDPLALLNAAALALTEQQPSINISMYPNVGSSNNSCVQINNMDVHQLQRLGGTRSGGGNVSSHRAELGEGQSMGSRVKCERDVGSNFSLCAHLDSCESSDVTGPNSSQQHSGYTAGPSHSTSIDKASVHTTTGQSMSTANNTPENSSNIQGLSSIQNATVNSDGSAGPQIFHQALSVDGTNASMTLSFASTAKSAPAALEYNACGFGEARTIHSAPVQCGRQGNSIEGGARGQASSGSATPTPGILFSRPLTPAIDLDRPVTLDSRHSSSLSARNCSWIKPESGLPRGSQPLTSSENNSSGTTPTGDATETILGNQNQISMQQRLEQTRAGVVAEQRIQGQNVSSIERRCSTTQPVLSATQYWV